MVLPFIVVAVDDGIIGSGGGMVLSVNRSRHNSR